MGIFLRLSILLNLTQKEGRPAPRYSCNRGKSAVTHVSQNKKTFGPVGGWHSVHVLCVCCRHEHTASVFCTCSNMVAQWSFFSLFTIHGHGVAWSDVGVLRHRLCSAGEHQDLPVSAQVPDSGGHCSRSLSTEATI